MAIDKKILKMCKSAIQQRLGGLDDLRPDLANTIANIFYRSFEISLRWIENQSSKSNITNYDDKIVELGNQNHFNDILQSALESYKDIENDRQMLEEMSYFIQKSNAIIKMIDELRKKYKSNESEGYINKTDQILDTIKYDIQDSPKKTSIMRAIERDMKEKDVDEIPDLYKYM